MNRIIAHQVHGHSLERPGTPWALNIRGFRRHVKFASAQSARVVGSGRRNTSSATLKLCAALLICFREKLVKALFQPLFIT